MNYIIDGYNLGHKIPSASNWLKKGETEKAIPIILNHIQAMLLRSGEIIVVFDGKSGVFPAAQYSSRIRVKFSRKPQTADDIIRTFIRNQAHPENWTVISSDNEIIYTARDMGAKVQSAKQFAAPPSSKSSGSEISEKYQPQNVDVDEWLKLFNAKGNK